MKCYALRLVRSLSRLTSFAGGGLFRRRGSQASTDGERPGAGAVDPGHRPTWWQEAIFERALICTRNISSPAELTRGTLSSGTPAKLGCCVDPHFYGYVGSSFDVGSSSCLRRSPYLLRSSCLLRSGRGDGPVAPSGPVPRDLVVGTFAAQRDIRAPRSHARQRLGHASRFS